MKMIFNYLNKIILFTMFNIPCGQKNEDVFRPRIQNLQAADLGLVSEGNDSEADNQTYEEKLNNMARDRFNHQKSNMRYTILLK